MAIIKRLEKGSELTHAELDNNFTEIEAQLETKEVKFTNITENQYGTHPAFTTQAALNIWLLQNSGAATYNAITSATVSNLTDTSFDYQIT